MSNVSLLVQRTLQIFKVSCNKKCKVYKNKKKKDLNRKCVGCSHNRDCCTCINVAKVEVIVVVTIDDAIIVIIII